MGIARSLNNFSSPTPLRIPSVSAFNFSFSRSENGSSIIALFLARVPRNATQYFVGRAKEAESSWKEHGAHGINNSPPPPPRPLRSRVLARKRRNSAARRGEARRSRKFIICRIINEKPAAICKQGRNAASISLEGGCANSLEARKQPEGEPRGRWDGEKKNHGPLHIADSEASLLFSVFFSFFVYFSFFFLFLPRPEVSGTLNSLRRRRGSRRVSKNAVGDPNFRDSRNPRARASLRRIYRWRKEIGCSPVTLVTRGHYLPDEGERRRRGSSRSVFHSINDTGFLTLRYGNFCIFYAFFARENLLLRWEK